MTNTPQSAKHFSPQLFSFLRDLKENNQREWFQANKDRYEKTVRHPARQFISDFGPYLAKISPHFNADPRPVGGSLFRIHRDVRFSKDKSPYKTHTGVQFRHKSAKDVHAPGFYLHLEPGRVFAGIGIWRPDGPTLKKIREFMAADPARWKRTVCGNRFRGTYELGGDSLVRPPKGFDAEHPLIEDLKRKDFIAYTPMTQKRVTSAGFLADYTAVCKAAAPFMRYLCDAVGVEF